MIIDKITTEQTLNSAAQSVLDEVRWIVYELFFVISFLIDI